MGHRGVGVCMIMITSDYNKEGRGSLNTSIASSSRCCRCCGRRLGPFHGFSLLLGMIYLKSTQMRAFYAN
jgi:hypothetical protein